MKLFGIFNKAERLSSEERDELICRLQQWHEEDEHDKIIEKLEALPQEMLDYDLTNKLARAYNNKANDGNGEADAYYAKALQLLESVADEGRTDAYWNYRMGYSLQNLGREDEAVPYFEQVLEIPKSEKDCEMLNEDTEELLRQCRPIAEFLDEPMEQEQAYYEKESVMIAIPSGEFADDTTLDFIPERIAKIEGVEVIETPEKETGACCLRILYNEEEFEIRYLFYPAGFDPDSWKLRQKFTEAEMEQAMRVQTGIGVSMAFGQDYLDSYHLQLKIMNAIVPDAVAVIDESAEQVLLGRWVSLAAASAVPPPSDIMYVVQAVSDDAGAVWIHTHGLARCHVPELELIGINTENYQSMAGLLNSTARVILNENELARPYQSIYVGALDNQNPLYVTLVPWEEAIKQFPDRLLGGKYDRKHGHNTYSAAIYYYPSEEAEEKRDYRHISRLQDLLGDRDIYFFTKRESEHMHVRALERIDYLIKVARETPENAIVKLGLTTDHDTDEDEETKEHIWFEMVAMASNTTFMAKCLNEPLWVSRLKQGDVGTYSIDQISDWVVRCDGNTFTPNDIYML